MTMRKNTLLVFLMIFKEDVVRKPSCSLIVRGSAENWLGVVVEHANETLC